MCRMKKYISQTKADYIAGIYALKIARSSALQHHENYRKFLIDTESAVYTLHDSGYTFKGDN